MCKQLSNMLLIFEEANSLLLFVSMTVFLLNESYISKILTKYNCKMYIDIIGLALFQNLIRDSKTASWYFKQ